MRIEEIREKAMNNMKELEALKAYMQQAARLLVRKGVDGGDWCYDGTKRAFCCNIPISDVCLNGAGVAPFDYCEANYNGLKVILNTSYVFTEETFFVVLCEDEAKDDVLELYEALEARRTELHEKLKKDLTANVTKFLLEHEREISNSTLAYGNADDKEITTEDYIIWSSGDSDEELRKMVTPKNNEVQKVVMCKFGYMQKEYLDDYANFYPVVFDCDDDYENVMEISDSVDLIISRKEIPAEDESQPKPALYARFCIKRGFSTAYDNLLELMEQSKQLEVYREFVDFSDYLQKSESWLLDKDNKAFLCFYVNNSNAQRIVHMAERVYGSQFDFNVGSIYKGAIGVLQIVIRATTKEPVVAPQNL